VVTSRLWSGDVVGVRRDHALIDQLATIVARCALGQRLLMVDGFCAYVEAFKWACATYQSHPPSQTSPADQPRAASVQDPAALSEGCRCAPVDVLLQPQPQKINPHIPHKFTDDPYTRLVWYATCPANVAAADEGKCAGRRLLRS
jgi:hypothetical protein